MQPTNAAAAGRGVATILHNDSSAKLDDNFRVKVDWLVAWPSNHNHSCLGMVAHLMWTQTAFMLFAPMPATINHGTADDIGSDRPFDTVHFPKEKIHSHVMEQGWVVCAIYKMLSEE
ncbi:hypothetical protein MHU86_13154 [Fragilaria crotonensis]|nr:hypothetical protein MHU86_13154 [Fragilaria crotonensis]